MLPDHGLVGYYHKGSCGSVNPEKYLAIDDSGGGTTNTRNNKAGCTGEHIKRRARPSVCHREVDILHELEVTSCSGRRLALAGP